MKKFYLVFLFQMGSLFANPQQILVLDGPDGRYPHDTLDVYVADEKGEPMHQLQKEDIIMMLSDEPVMVEEVRHLIETKPVRMLFVVDISGTMAGPPLENTKHALASWMGRLPANIETGLSTIGNTFRIVQDFTNNRTSILHILDTLQARDRYTELFYGVYSAIDRFSRVSKKTQNIIVLFSDGHNEGSDAFTLQDCVDLAQKNRVLIQAIGFHRIDSIYLKNLEKLGRMSGGIFINPRQPQDIGTAYNYVYRYLFSSYRITYNLEENSSGTHLPLRIGLSLPLSSQNYIVYAGLIDVPGHLSSYIIAILGILLVAILFTLVAFWRRKQVQINHINKSNQEQNAGLWRKMNSYRKNLDALKSELEQNNDNQGSSTDDVEKQNLTQILDDRVPLNLALDFSSGQESGEVIPVDSFPSRIGKGKNADVKLTEPTVSRMHAIIIRKPDGFQLEDLHSTNGTWVNKKKISVNMLHNGDEIQFGKACCTVKID